MFIFVYIFVQHISRKKIPVLSTKVKNERGVKYIYTNNYKFYSLATWNFYTDVNPWSKRFQHNIIQRSFFLFYKFSTDVVVDGTCDFRRVFSITKFEYFPIYGYESTTCRHGRSRTMIIIYLKYIYIKTRALSETFYILYTNTYMYVIYLYFFLSVYLSPVLARS